MNPARLPVTETDHNSFGPTTPIKPKIIAVYASLAGSDEMCLSVPKEASAMSQLVLWLKVRDGYRVGMLLQRAAEMNGVYKEPQKYCRQCKDANDGLFCGNCEAEYTWEEVTID